MDRIMAYITSWIASTGMTLATLALRFLFVFVAGLILVRIIMGIVNRLLEKSKLEKAAHSLIKTLVKTVLLVLFGLILASTLGIDVTGIVALASVLTLAVSLALQNMLANVIGGFTILYTHPFHSGDYVEIAGQSGTVHEVGIAYTKLITPDNKLVSIPNSAVVAAQIVNYTTTGMRRVELTVSASYDTPARQVIDTLVSCADLPTVLENPEKPYAVLLEYGESTMKYALRFWVKSDDYWSSYFTINEKIKTEFENSGVKMSYPHINVHLDK